MFTGWKRDSDTSGNKIRRSARSDPSPPSLPAARQNHHIRGQHLRHPRLFSKRTPASKPGSSANALRISIPNPSKPDQRGHAARATLSSNGKDPI